MPQFPFARHASEDVVPVDPVTMHSPERKLGRKQSLIDAVKTRWNRGFVLGSSGAEVGVEVEGGKEERDAKVLLGRRVSESELGPRRRRRAVPSLPRPQTFRRRESERRERLLALPETRERRRGWSVGGWGRERGGEDGGLFGGSAVLNADLQVDKGDALGNQLARTSEEPQESGPPPVDEDIGDWDQEFAGSVWDRDFDEASDDGSQQEPDPIALRAEFDSRWILNLSMSFRDKSQREKFFVTYAESPNRWRRLTISLDYRSSPPGSLESDLSSLHCQRDKSFRVFEALHESLADIQYYPTVTNLKLQTTPADNQLHVHVREDANEIISYPPASLFAHITCPRYHESSIELLSHLSGFVYKVALPNTNTPLINKEIPGPDTVDEFLYEVNALDSIASPHVISLRGLITSPSPSSPGEEVITGLLLPYCPHGALIDTLYSHAGTLPFPLRAKWAHQILSGLSAIHEAGFVQGDFTLSNIVLDEEDNAVIIDINRRGCPVGWEPPELARLIESGQRVAMCIGVKTDLWQLGMCLWALGEEVEEPERCGPLGELGDPIPAYYRRIVSACLSERPQGRPSAAALLLDFPAPQDRDERACVEFSHSPARAAVGWRDDSPANHTLQNSNPSISTHRSDKEYIDPALAVTLAEVRGHQHHRHRPTSHSPTRSPTEAKVEYLNPEDGSPNTSAQYDSSGSWVRGRSPGRRSSPFTKRTGTSATSLSLSSASLACERRRGVGKVYLWDGDGESGGEVASPRDRVPDQGGGGTMARMAASEPIGGLVEGRRTVSPESLPMEDKQLSECKRTTVPADMRSAGVRNLMREAAWESGYEPARVPMHQDSGFDEEMLEDLGIDDARENADTPRPGEEARCAVPA